MDLSFEQAKQIIDQKPLFDVNYDFSDHCTKTATSILTKLEQIWAELLLYSKSIKKGYSITVDLLQNAVKYRAESSMIHFSMTIDSCVMLILLENDIHACDKPKLMEYLDLLNTIDIDTCKLIYRNMISGFQFNEHIIKGYGLLDTKRKSYPRPILYSFSAEENGLVLFSIISTFEIKICENNPV